jgi:CHASE3 domain sensor protein
MRLTLRTRTNLVFALALATLGAIGWVSFENGRLLARNDALVSHTHEVLERSARLNSHLTESVALRRGYLLFGDPKFVEAFSEASRSASADLDELRRLTADNPEQQHRLGALQPLIQSRLSLLQQSIEAYRADPGNRAAQAYYTDQGSGLRQQISNQIAEFENVENSLLQERSASEAASLRLALRGFAILCLSVFIVLALAVWIVNRELTRRARAEEALARQESLLQSVLDNISDAVIVADAAGKFVLFNPAALRLHGGPSFDAPLESWPEAFGLYRADRLTPIPASETPMARAIRGESIDGEEVFVRHREQAEGRWHLVSGRPLINEHGQRHGGVLVIRDIDDRKRAEEERVRLIEELQQALARVKTLSGLLPICASCKKIRDDRGYWNQIESYIRDHSEAQFTHGLCPECLIQLYPELRDKHGS